MPFTLAYLDNPVPAIPSGPSWSGHRPADRREHFGTEAAALARAACLLPGPDWLDLHLYGPDGRLIAGPGQLQAMLGTGTVAPGMVRDTPVPGGPIATENAS